MSRVLWGLVVVALLGTLIGVFTSACKGGAVGVATCKTIEDALCERASSCGINIGVDGTPRHSDSQTDVTACEQFYSIECLHGLETSVTPTGAQIQNCVNAIANQAEGCDGGSLITDPQDVALNGACAWLIPPAPVVVDAAVTVIDGTVVDVAADTESNDSGLVILSP
jgi:hypothetical protein